MNWQYRQSAGAATDLISSFRRTLGFCNLQPGERLMVYSDLHTPRHYATAAIAAAQQIGTDVFEVTIPTKQPEIHSGAVWDVWHSADMVVDLESAGTTIYQPLRVSALGAGVRILRVTQPEDILLRLQPEPAVRDRVKQATEMLKSAKELSVTSPAGTVLTVNVEDRSAFDLWGAADQPGKWDHWSVGVVVGGANRPHTNGTLVMGVGDIILGMERYTTSRITLTIEEGIITRIDGGIDARLLRHWFEAWQDPRAYFISHVGWGCDPRADWNRLARKDEGGLGDAESFAGVFQIAFGRDTSWYIGGGTNDVPAHMDFNCLQHSLMLDSIPITQEGKFVHSKMQWQRRSTL
jgi:2,5-dihydroxypyridine 5,6-dioxygenase